METFSDKLDVTLPSNTETAQSSHGYTSFPLLRFPNEIIYAIAETLDVKTLNSFHKTNRQISSLLTSLLNSHFTKLKDEVFVWALKCNRADTLKRAINAGSTLVHVELPNLMMTALQLAAWYSSDAIVPVLLEAGVDVDSTCAGCTLHPLAFASDTGCTSIVRALLKHGGTYKPVHGSTIGTIHYAVRNSHTDTVRLLLEHAAMTEPVCSYDESTLQYAIQFGTSEIVEVFLDYGALKGNTDDKIESGDSTILYHAIRYSNLKVVEMLLERRGYDIHEKSEHGYTPLHAVAIYPGREEIGRLLLDRGADINRVADGNTPAVVLAVYMKNPPAVKMLLECGADIQDLTRNQCVEEYTFDSTYYGRYSTEEAEAHDEMRKVLVEAGIIS